MHIEQVNVIQRVIPASSRKAFPGTFKTPCSYLNFEVHFVTEVGLLLGGTLIHVTEDSNNWWHERL